MDRKVKMATSVVGMSVVGVGFGVGCTGKNKTLLVVGISPTTATLRMTSDRSGKYVDIVYNLSTGVPVPEQNRGFKLTEETLALLRPAPKTRKTPKAEVSKSEGETGKPKAEKAPKAEKPAFRIIPATDKFPERTRFSGPVPKHGPDHDFVLRIADRGYFWMKTLPEFSGTNPFSKRMANPVDMGWIYVTGSREDGLDGFNVCVKMLTDWPYPDSRGYRRTLQTMVRTFCEQLGLELPAVLVEDEKPKAEPKPAGKGKGAKSKEISDAEVKAVPAILVSPSGFTSSASPQVAEVEELEMEVEEDEDEVEDEVEVEDEENEVEED